jgi:pyruvate formate lyase activating enzyme
MGWETTSEELLLEVEKDRAFYTQSQGGVTFTGGEPLQQAEFLIETAKRFKKANLHLCLDTTAYANVTVFQKVSQYIDLFLFDLKHFDNESHIKYTGVSNHPILKNLEYLIHSKKEVVIRFPVIPGINDQPEHLEKMASYLQSLKGIKNIHLLPYHKIAQGKYEQFGFRDRMKEVAEHSGEEILKIKSFFEYNNFKIKIGG